MSDTSQELRELIWPLMPVDRCYGEPDVWCPDCQESLAEIINIFETYAKKRVIEELKALPKYSYPEENKMDREAVPTHKINARIAALEASLIDGEKSNDN